MYIYLSLLIAALGLLLYVLSAHPKYSTVGLVAWGAGLLAFLLQAANAHFGIVAR